MTANSLTAPGSSPERDRPGARWQEEARSPVHWGLSHGLPRLALRAPVRRGDLQGRLMAAGSAEQVQDLLAEIRAAGLPSHGWKAKWGCGSCMNGSPVCGCCPAPGAARPGSCAGTRRCLPAWADSHVAAARLPPSHLMPSRAAPSARRWVTLPGGRRRAVSDHPLAARLATVATSGFTTDAGTGAPAFSASTSASINGPVIKATVRYTGTCWPLASTLMVPVPVAMTLAGPPADPGVILIDADSTVLGRGGGGESDFGRCRLHLAAHGQRGRQLLCRLL
jgi:hypothetical protein